MVELHTFGETHLHVNGEASRVVLQHPKRFALFVYLVTADVTAHQRDRLLALFWPELPADRAQSALRKALHFIRAELGEAMLLNRGKDAIIVDRSVLRCDATALGVAFDAGEDDNVLRLYTGEFLAGFHISDAPEFEEWIEHQRRQYLDMAVKSALRLARMRAHADQTEEAVEAMEAAVRLAPYNALIVRSAVELMIRSGHTFFAIRTYADFARRLDEELGDMSGAATVYAEVEKLWTQAEQDAAAERNAVRKRLETLKGGIRIAG